MSFLELKKKLEYVIVEERRVGVEYRIKRIRSLLEEKK